MNPNAVKPNTVKPNTVKHSHNKPTLTLLKSRCWIVFIGLCFFSASSWSLKAPHNGTITCNSCHGAEGDAASPIVAKTAEQQENMCRSCHIVGGLASSRESLYQFAPHTVDSGGETIVIRCGACHDPHGSTETTDPHTGQTADNLFLIRSNINDYVTQAVGSAVYQTNVVAEDPNTFTFTEEPYTGICQNCHANTTHWQNDEMEDPVHNYDRACIDCHSHENGFLHGGGSGTSCGDTNSCHGTQKSHPTHLLPVAGGGLIQVGCEECHDTSNFPLFADGEPLASTTVCDNCHSPGGASDGVIMAKTNFETGVYETGRTALTAGNENWCASCHDDAPARSRREVFTPLVIDNSDLETSRVGDWTTQSVPSGHIGDDHEHSVGSGTGEDVFTWQPTLPRTGEYKVYAWWNPGVSNVVDAPYTVNYEGGSETVDKNQRSWSGGRWNLLGTFPFVAGSTGSVTLSDAIEPTGRVIVADAIKWDDPAVLAPNVLGDNTTYGYYVTGHKFDCLECHDANKSHVDHDARSYDADLLAAPGDTHAYNEAYRLRDVDGQPALVVPRTSQGSWALGSQLDEFALCLRCHDSTKVVGTEEADDDGTNFRSESWPDANLHWYHLSSGSVDSDWDAYDQGDDSPYDSHTTCTICHNVHGAPNSAMIRQGELISTPGSTDREPGFNFSYVYPGDGSAKARFTPTLPLAGDYEIKMSWNPYNNAYVASTKTQFTIRYNGGASTEIKTLNQMGLSTLGVFTFQGSGEEYVELSNLDANGMIFAFPISFERVSTGAVVTVDDSNASYEPSSEAWPSYGSAYRYYTAQLDPMARVVDTVGAMFDPDSNQPKICQSCHTLRVGWKRTPTGGANILNVTSSASSVIADGASGVLFTVWAVDPDGDSFTVTMDLSTVGGSATQLFYDDGTHGDAIAGDGIYSYYLSIPSSFRSGMHQLTIIASSGSGQSTAEVSLEIVGLNEIAWSNAGGDGLWSNPANWNLGHVPAEGEKVVFSNLSITDCIVDASVDSLGAMSLYSDYSGTVTFQPGFAAGTNELTITGDLKLETGTSITLKGDTSAVNEVSGGTVSEPHGQGIVINAANITVAAGASINADRQGFYNADGPGRISQSTGSATHGGYGGYDTGMSTQLVRYGSASQPTALGSAGGYSGGGDGGGAIKLVVADTLTVDGTISANGGEGSLASWGTGSGGSVWIITDTLSGTGIISANGGDGTSTDGGGGRISLTWTPGSKTFTGVISARSGGDGDANHGTVWVPTSPSNLWNELWNASNPVNGSVALVPGEYDIDHLHIASGASLELQGDASAINAASGGTAGNPHGSGVTLRSNVVNIEASAAISANYLGFPRYQGPGIGHLASTGGGYGGYGGSGNTWGGSPYGSHTQPTALGSGGGNINMGGRGGGAIKLIVADTITVDGAITATGGHGKANGTGGGSGGSIWILSDTLAGSGSISADGTIGESNGDGGGGGRISLQWSSGKKTFDGIIRAQGAVQTATNGTLYVYVPDAPANSWNELWNVGSPVNGSVALVPGEYNIDTLHVSNNSTLECQGDQAAINAASGGTAGVPHGQGVTINSTNITVDSGAAISADGHGFDTQGPGVPISYQPGPGHGGVGADYNSVPGGPTYGIEATPTALGSGGGFGTTGGGGRGGGAVKLDVLGTLTIEGSISANANVSPNDNRAAGSGGSLWITTDTLAGTGSISANGGDSISTNAAGGGGGRIGVNYNVDGSSLSGGATVTGGCDPVSACADSGSIIWQVR